MEHIAYNLDEVVDRSNTQSIKNDGMNGTQAPDTICMGIADMDFRCAKPILDALHARVDKGIFGYSRYEDAACKAATINWFKRRFNWEVRAEEVFYSPGIIPALGTLVKLLAAPGEGVVIQRPVYYPFTNMIEHNGRFVANNPLVNKNGDYTMDFADLEQKLADDKVKAMILCSPHNPVGRVWTPEELRRVVAIAEKYDKWIVSDEIHFDLTRKGVTHTPLLALCPEYAHRIVVCTAPSKTFNVAGMQLSNIVIPNRQLQQKWMKIMFEELGLMTANAMSLPMLTAAYNEGEDWLEQVRDYLDANMEFAAAYFKENLPKAVVSPAQGTYLLWVDLRAYCADAKELESRMTGARLALDEGYIFGEEGAGFERLNLACTRARLTECLQRMCAALQ